MQDWLENSDILMYSTHNEGKSVIAERIMKTLKDSKSYLSYLNKLVTQYNNTYHQYINKKPIN